MDSLAAAGLWRGEELQVLFKELAGVSVCAKCQGVAKTWFQSQATCSPEKLDGDLPQIADKIFSYLFYPDELKRGEQYFSCETDRRKYQEVCESFKRKKPDSCLHALLSFSQKTPKFDFTYNPVEVARQNDNERVLAASQLLAHLYLRSTKLALEVLPAAAEEDDLIRNHNPDGFDKVRHYVSAQDDGRLAKRQETADLRFHLIMQFFERREAQIEQQRKGGFTAIVATVVGAATAVAALASANPAGAVLAPVPAYKATSAGIDLVRSDFSEGTDPNTLVYTPFSEDFPQLAYGFNPSSSGLGGQIKGKLWEATPSHTVGFIKIEWLPNDRQFFAFDLNESEPIATDRMKQMASFLSTALKNQKISLPQFHLIIHLLRSTSLPRNTEEPANKLVTAKSVLYLTSALVGCFPHFVARGEPAESIQREKLAMRRLVEEEIATNLATGWPETVKFLKSIVDPVPAVAPPEAGGNV